jgi:hypothetical protein
MKNLTRWIASTVVVATVAGLLGGCIVESRHHARYRPVIVVR